ncbi:pseudouridine synthase [Apibacter raozihei]|uniref:pseudouridine synthase n=1 Tax=Apibacter TaxID=1778601 RepID=UPI000FE4116C|nr:MULTISPECIES: pseudouridine synthase [Apibacter]
MKNNSNNRRGSGRNEKSYKRDSSYSKDTRKENKVSKFDNKREDKPKRDFKSPPTFRKNQTKKTPEKEGTRLNKYIANSGVCSRREADLFIQNGVVQVNGKTITEFGYQVMPGDDVFFDGRYIRPEKNVYVLLNKPKGYISTTKDEKARKTVLDLVANASPYRLYPVGRLDRQTTGVLLLTNDGELTKKLTHPSHEMKKIYHVTLDRKVSVEDFNKLLEGLRFEEGVAKVDKVSFIEGAPKNEVGVEIHIGWNRIIRRMFERLGYNVEKLDRVMFAGLTKKSLKRGYWRILTDLEINNLKML